MLTKDQILKSCFSARIEPDTAFGKKIDGLTEKLRIVLQLKTDIDLGRSRIFAVFLPQVAPEQGWDLSTTLSYLSRKAGLPSGAWREGAKFETFQAEVFHE